MPDERGVLTPATRLRFHPAGGQAARACALVHPLISQEVGAARWVPAQNDVWQSHALAASESLLE